MRRPPPPVAIALVAALGACGGGDGGGEEPGGGGAASAGCKEVDQPQPRDVAAQSRPRRRLDSRVTYRVTVVTSCGALIIRLDPGRSPRATASFVSLARKSFYDGTPFHRIVPRWVIQGGDPTGTGAGGPGYSTRDLPASDTTYPRGTVAMAKAATDPPGTAGSQFFVVVGRKVKLHPEYAVIGRVVKGMRVADAISDLGDEESGEQGTPLRPVVIERTGVDAS